MKRIAAILKNQNLTDKLAVDEKETDLDIDNEVVTHFASEKVLANDWQTQEEDLAWRDL